MKGSSILIVEDEMIISMEIGGMLKKLGYNVAGSVISGRGAIQTARDKRPDLILMDIRLKGDMDGIEAAKKIMELYNIPVIFLTANSDETTIKRAVELKPAGILIKPFKERDLFGNIEMAIHKHKVSQKMKLSNSDKSYDPIAKKISSLKSPLLLTDSKGEINHVNKSAAKLIGIDKNKIIGRNISDIFGISPEQKKNNPDEQEFSIILPDTLILEKEDKNIQLRLSSGFVLNDQKEIHGFIFSLNNDAKSIVDPEKSWSISPQLMDSVNEIIFRVNEKMNIVQYNNNFIRLSKKLGISLPQLKRPVNNIMELSFLVGADNYSHVFKTDKPLTFTNRFKLKNNEIKYFRISLIPEYNEVLGTHITALIDDMTPIIRAKEQTQCVTDSVGEIEHCINEIYSIVNNVKKPLLNILKTSESKNDLLSLKITENAYEIIDLLENFDLQRLRHEGVIDNIYNLGKAADAW
ncbi:MAG: response regulator [Methanomicrobiaceae archaeon]|nr:response regulator [Methanomicrobiaceae archaeon]